MFYSTTLRFNPVDRFRCFPFSDTLAEKHIKALEQTTPLASFNIIKKVNITANSQLPFLILFSSFSGDSIEIVADVGHGFS
jgi:hypothetical protein